MGKKNIRYKQRQRIEDRKQHDSTRRNETNPFELKRNKIKHKVLGRKIGKNEIGKPLVNRNKAFKKRAETLLGEYQSRFKTGKGVKDLRSKSVEGRITEKYKESQNEVDFEQGQQVFLTHKGKPLDNFLNERPDSDDEDLDIFNRDDFIEKTHFGGGEEGLPRSQKEVLSDIMQEKHEKRVEKEEMAALTHRLDNDLASVRNLLRFKGVKEPEENNTGTTIDDYDKFMSQLMFDDSSKPAREVKPVPVVVEKTKAELDSQATPDVILKNKFKEIDSAKRFEDVISLLKGTIGLLQNGNKKCFQMIKERLLELCNGKMKFSPKEMSTLYMSVYFNELKVLAHLLIVKTLNRLKYSSLNEVAISIFLNNFILDSIADNVLYPEIFVHIHNLVRLGLNCDKTRLTMFNRYQFDGKCLLNMEQFECSKNIQLESQYEVNLYSLFNNVFSSQQVAAAASTPGLACSLLSQIVRLTSSLYDKYKNQPKLICLIDPIKIDLQQIHDSSSVPETIKTSIGAFFVKFEHRPAPVIVNSTRPKPFILPMLEPSFDETTGKKSRGDDTKKLAKKVRRETKGAQREIRKDSIYLRNVFLEDQERKDKQRQKKVKEILRDLSVQQGLYKKKK